jgi:predicted DsbA family dithiol-disulfide isomerase
MAESSLDSLRETRKVQIEWRAYELRPAEAPPPSPEDEARHRAYLARGWPRVQQIAKESFGLDLQRAEGGPHPTRLAHVGAKYAAEQGYADAYHRALFRAHWQELRDIASADVLSEIAVGLGLEEAAFRAALENKAYWQAVYADEYWAYQQGLQGVPAFIFGERYLLSGAQPPDVLREVVDKCIAEGRVS